MNTCIYSLTTILPEKTLNISKTNYREAPGVIPNLTHLNLEGENMYGSVKKMYKESKYYNIIIYNMFENTK